MSFRVEGKTKVLALGLPSVIAATLWSASRPGPSTGAGELVPTAPMHAARASHTSTLLASGKVVIAGGFAGSGSERNPYSSIEIYDPARGTFSLQGRLTVGRSGHTATLLKNGKILFAGGWGEFGPQPSAEIYDPATGLSVATGDMTVPRGGQTAMRLANGKVLLTGGEESEGHILAEAELYDPRAGRFTATSDMHWARFKLPDAVVRMENGKALIAGGAGRPEIYDPVTGTFAAVAGALDTARYFSSATLLGDGRVLVTGGYG